MLHTNITKSIYISITKDISLLPLHISKVNNRTYFFSLLVSLFYKKFYSEMNTTIIQTLPNEILEHIFQAVNQMASRRDTKECLYVCKAWYPIARQEFYKEVYINQSVHIADFLFSLENYDIGRYIQILKISSKSRHMKNQPFIHKNHTSLLFSMCINLIEVRLRSVNPYYILRAIETSHLKRLKKVDVCWSSCSSPPSVVKWFCRANLVHKESIKEINVPPLYHLNLSVEDEMFNSLLKKTERLSLND